MSNKRQLNASNPFGFLEGDPGDMSGGELAEQLAVQTEALELRTFEIARMVHNVMSEGRGPEFMDWLRSVTVEVQLIDTSGAYLVGSMGLEMKPEQWALYREGQNSFYHLLKSLMRMAEDGPPTNAGNDVATTGED